MSKRQKKNTGKPAMAPESTGCGPSGVGGFMMGYTDDINGEGAQLVDWQPTRAEFRVLGLHYLQRYYSTLQWCTAYEVSGSVEWRKLSFFWKRVMSIAGALGEDVVLPEWNAYISEQDKILSELESGRP